MLIADGRYLHLIFAFACTAEHSRAREQRQPMQRPSAQLERGKAIRNSAQVCKLAALRGGGARAELELRKYQGEVSSSEAAFRQCIYLHLQIFALAVQCCAFAWPRKAKAKGTDSTDSTALESLQQF